MSVTSHDVAEKPILFSGPMVRAILTGQKTQTRRILKDPDGFATDAESFVDQDGWWHPCADLVARGIQDPIGPRIRCPYGQPGDRLWLRETWTPVDCLATGYDLDEPMSIGYAADRAAIRWGHEDCQVLDTYAWNWEDLKWKPSIFMPRWASRITLEIGGVRVERLQDISEEDAKAEGVPDQGIGNMRVFTQMGANRYHFATLWDQINGKRADWMSNPWVWVVSFKRVQ